ncbi:hypothetical protein WA158_001766 [Blastocystis sp. Blastoise]
MSRPELEGPPEYFYNDSEAKKYTQNGHIQLIQSQLSDRALELLCLPPNESCYLLDVGCGSGLSGLSITEKGHYWVGCDVSPSMLHVAHDNECDGDIMLRDMGQGMPFRQGVFDGAISISAVQWLCYSNNKNEVPIKRLTCFFQSLYSCLKRGARAVLQLYPETPEQMELITRCAVKCGFTGGAVVDYPNSTKAKKLYLVLFAGNDPSFSLPAGKLGEGENDVIGVKYTARDKALRKRKGGKDKAPIKSKEWIMKKKHVQRQQGKMVANDSKYSGRKRQRGF